MLFLYFLISCVVRITESSNNEEICAKCPELKEQSHVFHFCQKANSTRQSTQVNQSCCIKKMSAKVEIIGMLENNSDLVLKTEDFDGLTHLEYLSLPPSSECPGGNNSWASTEKSNHSVICNTELNLCVDHNITCPNNNSHCVMTGPGKMDCLCNEGFYGYKCLRQGHFPTVVYTIALVSCTAVLSAFLWCTQRRKITKVHVH